MDVDLWDLRFNREFAYYIPTDEDGECKDAETTVLQRVCIYG